MTESKPQPGDRVRLVNTNGDTAEVTVASTFMDVVESEHNSFAALDGWSVAEILPKPTPAEPTGLGAVVQFTYAVNHNTLRAVRLSEDRWYDNESDDYDWATVLLEAVPGTIVVLSEGVQVDA